MTDIFEKKQLSPMLIGETSDAFDDPGYIYEMKWDGERCIAYLGPKEGTVLINKREVRMLPKVPELSKMHEQVKKRCILDGELTMLKDGKPDFEGIQRRSLMSNTFKIEIDAKRNPASFVAFDILYYDGDDLTPLPLMKRKEYLQKAVKKESERLAISRYIEGKGTAFYELAKSQNLEGIVAKRKDSVYVPGKRTKDWLKIKNLQDDDFVVCGYIFKEDHIASLVLGQYENGRLLYKGHVTMGVRGAAFEKVKQVKAISESPFDGPVPSGHGNENAVWLAPELVCTVTFMYRTENGGLRHPVFKGLRGDKLPADCTEQKKAPGSMAVSHKEV